MLFGGREAKGCHVENQKAQPLKALDARKRALDLPKAINAVMFEEMRSTAEEALRTPS